MASVINAYTRISSLDDYNKRLQISHDKLHLKSAIYSDDNVKLIVNSTALVNKYFDFIQKISYKITLSDRDFIKYRYQPKLYCNDMYGTTELWSLLLKINNWTSASEFKSKSFKIFDDTIFNVLNTILIYEKDYINDNKASIGY